MNARTALKTGIAQLREAGISSFTLAAEILLLHATNRDRIWLYAHPEDHLTEQQEELFLELIVRRMAGEPTQYLTGRQDFWGLAFEVTPAVLIPRPETEHVIEVALDRLAVREIRAGRPQTLRGDGWHIADIGTGSGCIAVALAKELPGATIYATDISSAALEVAARNVIENNFLERVRLFESNLLDSFSKAVPQAGHAPLRLDLIVSNPPYIGRREAPTLAREVRDHEPHAALFGGEEGYDLYANLIEQSAKNLMPGGILVLELGHDSLAAVRPLLDSAHWINVGVNKDLAGIPRVIAAERK